MNRKSPLALSTTGLVAVICLLGQSSPLEELDLPDRPPEAGLFARLLSTGDFVGPAVRVVAVEPGGPAAAKRFCLPADFQSQESLVLVADKMAGDFPRELVGLVKAAHRCITLIGLVSDDEGRHRVLQLLARNGLAGDSIRLLQLPCDTVWVRDFGPVFVRSYHSGLIALDFDYTRRSGDAGRRLDDAAAIGLAQQLNVPVGRVPFEIEQGDLLSSGSGLLVTTTRLFNNNISRGFDAQTIDKSLSRMFGCETIVVLEPLQHEPTGHVDVFACLVDPQTIVLGEYQASEDPENARVLQRNADLLSTVRLPGGPLRVVRLPMSGRSDDVWRTYTNVVFANGTLLVPQYEDAARDAAALAAFQRLLPAWQTVGVSAGSLIARDGALRCITLNVPKAAEGVAAKQGERSAGD